MSDQAGTDEQRVTDRQTGAEDVGTQDTRVANTESEETAAPSDDAPGRQDDMAEDAQDDAAPDEAQDDAAPHEAQDDEADEEERQKSAEEFVREHDPEKHDVAAGEEFRQRGDWTADEAGGPQVFDADGNLVEGSAPGQSDSESSQSDTDSTDQQPDRSGDKTDNGRRTSSLDEIRDGGYGVGSAAPIDGGAVPLGHPVKAWEDTKTFVTPEHEKYGDAEPHVWFADTHAAQRAGFRPVD